MPNDTVIKLIQPGTFNDQLTDVLRNGARALLAQAVEAEVADFLGTHADLMDAQGIYYRMVRRQMEFSGERGADAEVALVQMESM